MCATYVHEHDVIESYHAVEVDQYIVHGGVAVLDLVQNIYL